MLCPYVGVHVQVSIGKCLHQVKHYLIVMVMIMASFAVGIHYLYSGYIPSVDSPTRMHSKIVIKSPTYFKSYVLWRFGCVFEQIMLQIQNYYALLVLGLLRLFATRRMGSVHSRECRQFDSRARWWW
jgi:hypothetical protein